MDHFFDFLEQQFNVPKPSGRSTVSKMLVRKAAFTARYAAWIQDGKKDYWIGQLRRVYLNEAGHPDGPALQITRASLKGTTGWVLTLEGKLADRNLAQFLLDVLKDNVRRLNYVIHHSDERRWASGSSVLSVERHFLKPRFSYDESLNLLDQKYGNITIEYLEKDGIPAHIQFYAHAHNDRRYSDPLPFDDLINHVFV